MRFLALLMSLVLFGLTLNATPVNGDTMHGFTLIEKRFVAEVDAECLLFRHDKSGARLFKIANDDINKTFCISFKTITESDAGTPHILEHSVLNGSKNFPVKSPFDILSKGSLNTFLNAMTGSDITLYPVSSMNDKDFQTLMHIYLDAVFNPIIYEDPRILDQEGWHHDLESAESPVIYKGVVYNEMRGAFSSPTREWGYLVDQNLFPDTPYRFSSGGYPAAIPSLTHEAFLDFHRKYYHPSNSYIFLYGNGELEAELGFINDHYLSNYSLPDQLVDMPMQAPFESRRKAEGVYSATEGSERDEQSYLSLSYVSGESSDQKLGMGLQILAQVLFNNESAPVRLALQEAGIGKDIGAWIDDLRQNVFHVRVQNANPDDADKFNDLVSNMLKNIVAQGIDGPSIAGALNRMEFGLREGNTPQKGLSYNGQALGSWFWGDEPFSGLEYEKPLAELKADIPNGYLEGLIKMYFIDNNHVLLFTLNPKPGLEGENNAHREKILTDYKSSLSENQVQDLVQYTDELVEYQKSEDSPEALATIPLLELADIEPIVDWYEVEASTVGKTPFLHYEAFTNDVSYLRFFFDLRVLREDQLPYAALLSVFLGSIGTEVYSFGELDNALDSELGGFSTYLSTYLEENDDDRMIPKFVISAKALSLNQKNAFALSQEILLKSNLDDVERLKDVLIRHHSRLSASVKRDGLGYASKRLAAYSSKSGTFNELTSGLSYYWFVSELLEGFEDRKDGLTQELDAIRQTLFTKNNLMASATFSSDGLKSYKKSLKRFARNLPKMKPHYEIWDLKTSERNEGLMAASKVQYVLQGTDFKSLGYEWNGSIRVLNQIISREWLKNQVRVIGGAYGGFARFSPTGQVFFGSYRDPNLTETLENYAGTANFIKTLDLNETDMTRFIIGTISGMDRPTTPSQKGSIAVARYFQRSTQTKLQKERDAVLSTNLSDIKAYGGMIDSIISHSNICVYGNEEKLKENKTLFESLLIIE